MLRSARQREALRPLREERGGGILCRHAHWACLCYVGAIFGQYIWVYISGLFDDIIIRLNRLVTHVGKGVTGGGAHAASPKIFRPPVHAHT